MISRIKVPGVWADKFFTALVGSIPAMAIIGLVAWLLIFQIMGTALVYLLTIDGADKVSRLTADLSSHPAGVVALSTLKFFNNHPISALMFGPLLTIQGLFWGMWKEPGN